MNRPTSPSTPGAAPGRLFTPVAATPGSLEALLSSVEDELEALGTALRLHRTDDIDRCANALHRALTHAMDGFSAAARQAPLPAHLRQRLARAGAAVASQRESLSRASFALDHALEALMPRDTAALYRVGPGRPFGPGTGSLR